MIDIQYKLTFAKYQSNRQNVTFNVGSKKLQPKLLLMKIRIMAVNVHKDFFRDFISTAERAFKTDSSQRFLCAINAKKYYEITNHRTVTF